MNRTSHKDENINAWAKLIDPKSGLLARTVIQSVNTLMLAAHPDDETIGASAALSRLPNAAVVYLTDGAPRDKQLWSGGGNYSREEYACIRRHEAEAALEVVGIPVERIHYLGTIDQESVFRLRELAGTLSILLHELQPDALITHAYEGGHPDHDSAALVASLAVNSFKAAAAPKLLEMTSYHAHNGKCCMGEFLPVSEGQPGRFEEFIIQLAPEEAARKKRMMDCYKSQKLVLQNFPLNPERLRPAPKYNFSTPPHSGKLWYECMGWQITGVQWRELATQAIGEFTNVPSFTLASRESA
ncbi:MAG TPA: PIG-L deacetylase family protein [Terriglobales bacterium]|nr:PIG-L deacetylase family protein [Terriglobales bacterium]